MTQPDRYFIELERNLTTLSLAVQLVDDYAVAGEPLGRVTVSLAGSPRGAVRNPSGYYVFTDLPAATHELVVEADFYLRETVSVTTGGLQNLVKKIIVKPNSSYPFLSMATLIRGVVTGLGDEALSGATVQATTMVPDSSVKAKVGPTGVTAGDTGMVLVNITGQLVVGDRLMIKDANGSRVEFCRITAPLPATPGTDPFMLATPLAFSHGAGTTVHYLGVDSILDTRTTTRGEFVIYFSRTKTPRFITTVAISRANYQMDVRDVEVSEGTLVSLGRIKLIP